LAYYPVLFKLPIVPSLQQPNKSLTTKLATEQHHQRTQTKFLTIIYPQHNFLPKIPKRGKVQISELLFLHVLQSDFKKLVQAVKSFIWFEYYSTLLQEKLRVLRLKFSWTGRGEFA
jgi:hypothetical protein